MGSPSRSPGFAIGADICHRSNVHPKVSSEQLQGTKLKLTVAWFAGKVQEDALVSIGC